MPENKTYTQAEVDQMRQEASDKAFKAAEAKYKQTQALEETEAKLKRLQELEEAEAKRLEQAELNETISNLKADELKDTGLRGAGLKRFALEHKNDLKGLAGDELATKVKALKDELENEDKELFFTETEVNASGSLLGGDDNNDEEEIEYYPGTTIKRNK